MIRFTIRNKNTRRISFVVCLECEIAALVSFNPAIEIIDRGDK